MRLSRVNESNNCLMGQAWVANSGWFWLPDYSSTDGRNNKKLRDMREVWMYVWRKLREFRVFGFMVVCVEKNWGSFECMYKKRFIL